MIRRTLTATFAVLAVLATGALSATAAQAAEGPFYKIAGSRLLSGSSEEAKITTASSILMTATPIPGFTIDFQCGNVKTSSAKLLGSTGANFSSSEEQFEVSSCTLTKNGSGCSAEGPLSTVPLKGKLVYSDSERKGVIDVEFRPASAELIIDIKFVGSCTFTGNMAFSGAFVGELWSGGKPVEAGSEPAAGSTLEVRFPSTPIKTAWSETSGSLVEALTGVEAYKKEAKIEGALSIELSGGGSWGVFTK